MNTRSRNDAQQEICAKYGAEFCPALPDTKLGIAENVRRNRFPIHGLRHPPVGNTSGWYVWSGDALNLEPDFFKPLHIAHVDEWCPGVRKFLGLAPGWRFFIAQNYEDVWFDPILLNVK